MLIVNLLVFIGGGNQTWEQPYSLIIPNCFCELHVPWPQKLHCLISEFYKSKVLSCNDPFLSKNVSMKQWHNELSFDKILMTFYQNLELLIFNEALGIKKCFSIILTLTSLGLIYKYTRIKNKAFPRNLHARAIMPC
jgi:hypothetical protein